MEDESDRIRALEARRCALLGVGDTAGLAALLAEDYVHVHGNGQVTDKAATLARVAANPRLTERGPLDVRIWGDVALIVGEQRNRVADGATRAVVTQTLRRSGDRWLFQSLHFTAIRD